MEIAPVPHRSSRGEWRRLALGLLVLAPVVLLLLLPAGLGLDRYVVTGDAMGGHYGRGAVVLARQVPVNELQDGDVITFTVPSADGKGPEDRVTRQIKDIENGVATTQGTGNAGPDAVPLDLDKTDYARAWLSIPWIGYPFVVDGGWIVLTLAAAGALALAASGGRRRPQRVTMPAGLPRPKLPVA